MPAHEDDGRGTAEEGLNPLTDDMCSELWGELEAQAMWRQTLARHSRCTFPSDIDVPLVQRDVAELDVVLCYALGRGTTALEYGQRLFVKPADLRWQQ